MRLSCNGCRILRKGCSDDCVIRPCLQWLKSPEAQAHATVFLAKFYGRTGLLNLIAAAGDHLRPAIFRSLLYEACGRIVNPVYGSVGLLWSGNWQLCQAAVDAVLRGDAILPISPESTAAAAAAATANPFPPAKALIDIRHISKDPSTTSKAFENLHKIVRGLLQFKRSVRTQQKTKDDVRRAVNQESESSRDTAEASHVSQAEPKILDSPAEEEKVDLELTLGLESFSDGGAVFRRVKSAAESDGGYVRGFLNDDGACGDEIGLAL